MRPCADPAHVAALAGLRAVGVVAGERREVGAAGGLLAELVDLGRCPAGGT